MKSVLTGLYAITDPIEVNDSDIWLKRVLVVLSNGANIIQYRNKLAPIEQCFKEAQSLKALCDRYDKPLIINDHLEIAQALKCGLHIGKDDTSITNARSQLGKNAIIGATCKNSLSRAEHAINEGADYIAFGAFYSSHTKKDAPLAQLSTLRRARQLWPSTSIVAIGGINPQNCKAVLAGGADMVAAIHSLWGSADLATTCNQFQHAILNTTP